MSEYQSVAFRAIDAPVTDKNLEYMRQQSSRAEITEWSFANEYQFGDFRGDAIGMLQRGYDIHLHYANFGIRKLMLRLPEGWPDADAAKAYLNQDCLEFKKDTKGHGGVLVVHPFYESGYLQELWNLDEYIDKLAPLRAEILDGDLRPLYLFHLAVCLDNNHDPEETHEAPVPAVLDQLTPAQQALAEFYEIPELVVQAAAQAAPTLKAGARPEGDLKKWTLKQPAAQKNEWLSQLLDDPQATRSRIKCAYRAARTVIAWPTTVANRTIQDIGKAAEDLEKAKKPSPKGPQKIRKT